VAVAVAVLSGALLVGDSGPREPARLWCWNVSDERIRWCFRPDSWVNNLSRDFKRIRNPKNFGIAPLIIAQGFVTVQGNEGRAGKVLVYGVDARFWNVSRCLCRCLLRTVTSCSVQRCLRSCERNLAIRS
jgi:hypothetical protein